MGTSRSFEELAGKMGRVGENIEQARLASFRQAERDMQPLFNAAARAAAGGDRKLSNKPGGHLHAEFQVRNGASLSELKIKPKGPWGIRDNTDVGGNTAAHDIYPVRARRLSFVSRRSGQRVYRASVSHPGSARGPFWGDARTQALTRVRTRIPLAVHDAIVAALNGSGFRSRGKG